MIEGGYREARPFGLRQAQGQPDASKGQTRSGIRGWPEDGDWSAQPRPAGPLSWALRTAALAGLVALFATQYLVRISGPGEVAVARIAQGGRNPAADPETTGSIGRSGTSAAASSGTRTPAGAAQATRLDPCAVPR